MAATGAVMAFQMLGAYNESENLKLQAKAEEGMYEINERLVKLQAEDAVRRGKKEEKNFKRSLRGFLGSQKVALAAQGIDINSGSAAQVLEDTAILGEEDAQTIRMNAYREAYGFESQALSINIEKEFNTASKKSQAQNTLIAGGINAVSSGFQTYASRNPNKPKSPKKSKKNGPSGNGYTSQEILYNYPTR